MSKGFMSKHPNDLTTGETIWYGVVFTATVTAAYCAALGVGCLAYSAYETVKQKIKERKQEQTDEDDYCEWCPSCEKEAT